MVNALDLAHFVAQTVFTYIWKKQYYFTDRGSLDEFGVVVVVFVSPKEVELQLFFLEVSNDCEWSLSLTLVLTLLIFIWYNTEYDNWFTPIEASQALFSWVCIEVSEFLVEQR